MENKTFLHFGTKFGPNRYLFFEILKINIKFEISVIELVKVTNIKENKAFLHFGTKFGPNRYLLFEIRKKNHQI